MSWCNWISVFKMVFCSIWPLPEHCHESSAGTSSFSLSSHFFTAYEDLFPSRSIPVLEPDPIVGGCGLAVVAKCQGTPGSVRAARGQRCLRKRIHPSVRLGFISSAFSQPQLGAGLSLLRDGDRERHSKGWVTPRYFVGLRMCANQFLFSFTYYFFGDQYVPPSLWLLCGAIGAQTIPKVWSTLDG